MPLTLTNKKKCFTVEELHLEMILGDFYAQFGSN
jgi:hypothetical protein